MVQQLLTLGIINGSVGIMIKSILVAGAKSRGWFTVSCRPANKNKPEQSNKKQPNKVSRLEII